MATLSLVEWLFLGCAVAMAAVLLGWLRSEWNILEREHQRQVGWHRMWTERIMNTTDERDERSGPP